MGAEVTAGYLHDTNHAMSDQDFALLDMTENWIGKIG